MKHDDAFCVNTAEYTCSLSLTHITAVREVFSRGPTGGLHGNSTDLKLYLRLPAHSATTRSAFFRLWIGLYPERRADEFRGVMQRSPWSSAVAPLDRFERHENRLLDGTKHSPFIRPSDMRSITTGMLLTPSGVMTLPSATGQLHLVHESESGENRF
jgi:hypothetical protein